MLNLLLLFCSVASAVSSLSGSASFGYYRDDQQNAHVPLVYSFSYSAIHTHGVETSLDFFLNNDFTVNQWQVNASQALVLIPLSQKTKSRVQLGRQLFLEGFDLSLLDGLQAPLYWSSTGGLWLYGGNARVLDLHDSTSSTISGFSIFQEVLDFNTRLGYNLSGKYAYGNLSKAFDSIPTSPSFLTKHEWDQNTNSWTQSFNEIQFSIFALSHSLRNPRKLTSNANTFVYYVLAQSAQETSQASARFDLTNNVSVQAFTRWLRYKSGAQMEMAYQQELMLSIQLNEKNILSPVFGHILGYGGELWDTGFLLQSQITEKTSLRNEVSAAYLNKVNNILGWAYQVRSGVNYELADRWLSSVWVEAERNHLFIFDARILANVTYFN